jgi:hypothetical protein
MASEEERQVIWAKLIPVLQAEKRANRFRMNESELVFLVEALHLLLPFHFRSPLLLLLLLPL